LENKKEGQCVLLKYRLSKLAPIALIGSLRKATMLPAIFMAALMAGLGVVVVSHVPQAGAGGLA